MDEPTKAGFRLGMRVAARLLLEAAEELDKLAAEVRAPANGAYTPTITVAGAAEKQAELLRRQADIIRTTTPEQVHVHRR